MAAGKALARLASYRALQTLASLLTIVLVTGLTRVLLPALELDLSSFGLRPILVAGPAPNDLGHLSSLIAGAVALQSSPADQDSQQPVAVTPGHHALPTSRPAVPALPTSFPVTSDSLLLLPILPFGPNNQFRAFREALILGQWLNRTVVLPPFFKHHTAAKTLAEADTVEVHEIFNWNQLASLQPVTTWQFWQSLCGSRLEVLLQFTKPEMVGQFARIEKMFQLVGIPGDYETTKSVREPLEVSNSIPSLLDAADGNRLFPSRKRCAAVLFPYRHVDISHHNVDLAMHLRRTKHLHNLAAHFVATVFKQEPFAVLHWRYNSDWSGTWCHQGVDGPFDASKMKNQRYARICREIVGLNVTRVIRGLRQFLLERQVAHLYVATPVSDFTPVMSALRSAMPRLKASRELLDVVGERSDALQAAGLSAVASNFELSLVEQELASVAKVFIGSELSSWSANVAFERSGLMMSMPAFKESVIWINRILPHQ